MNSALPSAIRTPIPRAFLIWFWPPCRGVCIIFQRGVLLCFGLFFPQHAVADLPRENRPSQLIFGTCLMNLKTEFARALSGSTGLIIALVLIPDARLAIRWSGELLLFSHLAPLSHIFLPLAALFTVSMKEITEAGIRRFLLDKYREPIGAIGLIPDDLTDEFDLLLNGVIDSFGVLEMISAIEKEFQIELDLADLDAEQITILGPLSRYVAERGYFQPESFLL